MAPSGTVRKKKDCAAQTDHEVFEEMELARAGDEEKSLVVNVIIIL